MATIEDQTAQNQNPLINLNAGRATAGVTLGLIGTILGGIAALAGGGVLSRMGYGGLGGYGMTPNGAQPVVQTPPKYVTQPELDAAKENSRLDAENKLLQAKLYTKDQTEPLAISNAKLESAVTYQQKEIDYLASQLGKVATLSVPLSDVTVPYKSGATA